MTQNPENVWENQESNNKISQNHDELKALYKRKVDEYMDWEKNKNPNIFDKKVNTWWELDKFKKFLSATGDQVLFPEKFLTSDFAKNTLKTAITSYVMTRKNLFSSVEKSFQNQFDFSFDASLFPKVQEEYKKLSNQELKELWMYASFREKYIISLFKATPDILEKILTSHENDERLLKAIFGNIPNEIKQNQDTLLSLKKLQQAHSIHFDDIKNILNILENNIDAKKSLISYFLPNISLQDALDLWIISKTEAETQILKMFKDIFKSQDQIFSQEDVKASIAFIDTRSIFISTQSLNDAQWNGIFDDKKNTQILTKITKEINALNANLKEDLDFTSFEDFQKQVQISSHISPEVKSQILKLQKGSYMNLAIKSAQGKKENNYFYLENIIDTDSQKEFKFVNITREGGNVTKSNKWTENVKTFDDFYQHLIDISKNNALLHLELFTESEFKDYTQKEWVDLIAEWEEVTDFEELKKLMDEVDPDFKKIGDSNSKNFSFRCKRLEENTSWNRYVVEDEVYQVTDIDSQWVHIKWHDAPMSIWEFARAFQVRKVKRFPTMKNVGIFFEYWKKHENYSESLQGFELKDNKIIQKESSWNKKAPAVKYFVGPNKEAIEILKLNDGTIDFREWEFNESKDNKKPSKFKKQITGKGISYDEFYLYITEKNLKPYTKNIPVSEERKEDEIYPKRKRSLFSSWLWCLSLSEVVSAWKQIISSIEDRLQTGNKLKSAKFALAMWKYLPASIREDLQSMVEWAEKKTMEDLLSHLTTLDSKIMIPRIVRILENKSSPQYEVEAALFAMLSKYGTLYNKKPLNTYRGSFIWYEALWWKKGDELYTATKKECEDAKLHSWTWKPNPKPFTEEMLIEKLLWLQAEWKKLPKRRSKIHKEMWSHLNTWINDELEDGANKTWDMITLEWRISYCINELKSWWYANGLWALEKIWGKWWDVHDMHAIPFIITMTWISKNFPEKLLWKFLSWMWRGTPYTEIMFNKDSNSLKKFQKAMKEIVISLYWENSKQLDDLLSIWSDVEKAYAFWNKYWEAITTRMTLKDGYVFVNKDENSALNSYYEFLSDMQNDAEFSVKTDDILNGAYSYWNTPITLTSWRKNFEKFVSFPNGVLKGEWDVLLSSLVEQLHDLKNQVFDADDKNRDNKLRKEIFKELYILAHANVIGQWNWYEQVLKTKQVMMLERNGINIRNFGKDLADKNTRPWEQDSVYGYTKSEAFQKFLDEQFENFMNTDYNKVEDQVNWNIWDTKKSIDQILNSNNS